MANIFKSIEKSYRTLRVLPLNPRFTNASQINIKNLRFDNYNLQNAIEKTLQFEGNFSDLLELTQQMASGYNPALDQVFVIKGVDGEYYVLEGNRRLIVINFFKNSELCNTLLNSILQNENTSNESAVNIQEIIDIVTNQEFVDNFDSLPVMEAVYDDSTDVDEIWSIIFTRHAGENKGKRGWTRALYFADLRDFYFIKKNKFDKQTDVFKSLSRVFNKSFSSIQRDIRSALWVSELFKASEKNLTDRENQINFYEDISSLELCYSTIKLKIANQWITLQKVCQIEISIFEWNVKIKKINFNALSKFLLESIKQPDPYYTTRGWKNEYYYILNEFITSNISDPDIKIENYKTIQTVIKEGKSKTIQTEIERQLIFLESNLETVSDGINSVNSKQIGFDEKISKSIVKLWRDNIDPILDLFQQCQPNDFPFLIYASIVRSLEELISTFLFTYNFQWRDWIKEKFSTDIHDYDACIDTITTYNKTVGQMTNNSIYAAYKEKVREVSHKQISDSLVSTKWDGNFSYLSSSANLNVWIRLISKYATSGSTELNNIIHKYYYVLDDTNVVYAYNFINNLIIDISNLIRTLFK